MKMMRKLGTLGLQAGRSMAKRKSKTEGRVQAGGSSPRVAWGSTQVPESHCCAWYPCRGDAALGGSGSLGPPVDAAERR